MLLGLGFRVQGLGFRFSGTVGIRMCSQLQRDPAGKTVWLMLMMLMKPQTLNLKHP